MTRPTLLHVGTVDYQIRWADEVPGKFGETDTAECVIRICKLTAKPQQRPTLFHEIIHATLAVFGPHLTMTERAARTSIAASDLLDTEELYVRALEVGLMQVIRDNPAVFDWLKLSV